MTDISNIVTLTSTPSRISKIEPVLESIFSNTLTPDLVVINVPFRYSRTNEEYIIPEFLTIHNHRIVLNRCEDMGPITKLVPTLDMALGESNIITIDDDIIYPPNFLSGLVEASLNDTESSFCYSGFDYSQGILCNVNEDLGDCMVAEGVCGVLYKGNFFEDDFYDYISATAACRSCFYYDDVVISNYLSSKGIKRLVINTTQCNKAQIMTESNIQKFGYDNDALHCIGKNDETIGYMPLRYERCINYLGSLGINFLGCGGGNYEIFNRYENVVERLNQDTNVVIYGFNDYGRELAKIMSTNGFGNLLAFIDKRFEEGKSDYNDIPLLSPQMLTLHCIDISSITIILATDFHFCSMENELIRCDISPKSLIRL